VSLDFCVHRTRAPPRPADVEVLIAASRKDRVQDRPGGRGRRPHARSCSTSSPMPRGWPPGRDRSRRCPATGQGRPGRAVRDRRPTPPA
jgi:hypothetical protein